MLSASWLRLVARDKAWHIHFEEADVQSYGTRHEEVVVFADDSTKSTIWLSLIVDVLVDAAFITFDIHTLTNDLDKRGDNHWLCSYVGMEAVLAWQSLAYVLLGLAASIEIGVDVLNLIEDELRLVAVYLTLLVVCFQCVALNDEIGIVVVCGNLCCSPCKQVDVEFPSWFMLMVIFRIMAACMRGQT